MQTPKHFGNLLTGGKSGEQSCSFEEDDLPKVLTAMEEKVPVTVNGLRINGSVIRTVSPDYQAFINWSDDALLIENEPGVFQYCLQDRTEKGAEILSYGVHIEVYKLVESEVKKSLSNGSIQKLLSTPVDKMKSKMLS